MPAYVFYPRRSDGGSLTFSSASLPHDRDALDHAQAMLSEHPSSVEVAVWDGDRPVGRRARDEVDHHNA